MVQKVNNFCFSIIIIIIPITTIDDDLTSWKGNTIKNFLLSIISIVTLPYFGVEVLDVIVDAVLLVVVDGLLQVHKDVSFKIALIFDWMYYELVEKLL